MTSGQWRLILWFMRMVILHLELLVNVQVSKPWAEALGIQTEKFLGAVTKEAEKKDEQ